MPVLSRGYAEIKFETVGEDRKPVLPLNGGFMNIKSWQYVWEKLPGNYYVILHDRRGSRGGPRIKAYRDTGLRSWGGCGETRRTA